MNAIKGRSIAIARRMNAFERRSDHVRALG